MPTLIMCDCQSVVKTLNKLLEEKQLNDDLKERDLWEQIAILVQDLDFRQIGIQWMPGHLDAKEKEETRKKLLANGTVLQEDIEGNVKADALANQGAAMHKNIDR